MIALITRVCPPRLQSVSVRALRHLAPAEPHRQVRLYFSAFGLEQGKDFVNVYDGGDESAPLLARLTGHTLPPPLLSTSGSLLVVMVTDDANNDIGFEASYFDECTSGYVPGSGGGATKGSGSATTSARGLRQSRFSKRMKMIRPMADGAQGSAIACEQCERT